MKHHLNALDYALWLTMIGLQFTSWLFSLSAGLQRLHPRFVFYLGFLCVKSSMLLVVSLALPYSWYYWSFYAGIAIETLLLLLVVYEIFRNTFAPLGVLRPGTIARLAGWMIVTTAVFITIGIWRPAPTSSFADSVTALLRTTHQTVTFSVAVALWSLVMYARGLAIPWRSRTAGIAAGFLFCLSAESFVRAGQSMAPHAWFIWFDRLLAVVFLVTLALWILATRRPEETATELPTPDVLRSIAWSLGTFHHGDTEARKKI